MTKIPLRVFALLLFAALAVPAAAQGVYKWTDEKGVVHFTDRPPARDDAVEVPGVRARPSEEERRATTIEEVDGDAVTAEMLQGLWCEYELTYSAEGSQVLPRRIEWDFYEGDELQHRDLESGRRVDTTFSVDANVIVPASVVIGQHLILDYRADGMELGLADAIHRLRRGGC